jgi:hypothetical protein
MKLKNMKTFEEHTSELNISDVMKSNRPKLEDLTYYPFRDKRNIVDKDGNIYYYYELINMGYSTMDLHKVKRDYSS